MVLAVTAIGGHATCETQAAYLNLPSPVTTYTNHQEAATTADKEISLISMTKAANEAKNIKPALIYRCQSMAHGNDIDFQLKMAL